MKNPKFTFAAALMLMVVCAVALHAQILDYLEVMYFAEDGSRVALLTTGYSDSVGAPLSPLSRILIYDTSTAKLVESLDYTEFVVFEGPDDKRMKAIEEKKKSVREYLGVIGLSVEPQPGMLPDGTELKSRVETINQSEGRYRLTFYLREFDTGHTLKVYGSDVSYPSSLEGFMFGTDNYSFPNGDGFVAIYALPSRMEFDPGQPGFFIVNQRTMANFYNGVGFAFYKRKNHQVAIDYFFESYRYDPRFPKAAYNIACIRALNGDVEGCLEYLQKLFRDNDEALKLLDQVDKDSDFNGIRKDPRFEAFMKKVR